MINPIAFAIIALGVVLLLFGAVLATRHRKTAGVLLGALGLIAITMPFWISVYLASAD